MAEPTLSVVVAVWQDTAGLNECLAALEAQRDTFLEVIVVGTVPKIAAAQWTQWIDADPGALIPQLWATGMARARGDVIAITTAHFAPAPQWAASIRAAFADESIAAAGGTIDPPRGGGAVNWATYLLRYSATFHHRDRQLTNDVAGDNAAYRRADLQRHSAMWREGFWEPEYHRLLLAEDRKIAFVPDMRVTQRACFGMRGFMHQRFAHGRHFGADRLKGRGIAWRVVRIATSPLIVPLLLAKVVARVVRHRPQFVAALVGLLPVLACFITAWAAGETCGYVIGPRGDQPHHRSLAGKETSISA